MVPMSASANRPPSDRHGLRACPALPSVLEHDPEALSLPGPDGKIQARDILLARWDRRTFGIGHFRSTGSVPDPWHGCTTNRAVHVSSSH